MGCSVHGLWDLLHLEFANRCLHQYEDTVLFVALLNEPSES